MPEHLHQGGNFKRLSADKLSAVAETCPDLQSLLYAIVWHRDNGKVIIPEAGLGRLPDSIRSEERR